MIYEIFNSVDGATLGYRVGLERAKQTCERCGAVRDNKTGTITVMDYLPAREGFYVLDMRDTVKAGPFPTREEARSKADFENMASDTNSFHVYRQEV